MDITLKSNSYTLHGEKVILRPLTEQDWQVISWWETDPAVIYWADSDLVESRTIEEVKKIFRMVSQNAYCFIVEVDSIPVGTGWLQHMNMEEILRKYPGQDCRRIDLALGKNSWEKGFGTDTIRTLTQFALKHEKADLVFGGPGDYNLRSQNAFIKAGFRFSMKLKDPPRVKHGSHTGLP